MITTTSHPKSYKGLPCLICTARPSDYERVRRPTKRYGMNGESHKTKENRACKASQEQRANQFT